MGDVPQVEAVVTAQPLTPELEREMRSGNLTPEIRTVWATLDQARARIVELEGTAQEVQSLATNYKRVRAGLVALEVERLMIVQKDLIRQIERMRPVVEAAMAEDEATTQYYKGDPQNDPPEAMRLHIEEGETRFDALVQPKRNALRAAYAAYRAQEGN